ncbi:bifunctional chorismate-binding protein/class IV aminotransferase [Polynucleobacter sp. Tro8-14-1]|uniref:bifunctional chorismate-binding protein/class IV aminotransferase n=1 Tax=Polynucleobacter sp. Tro8-14-1 TaxID=1758383 RepID=UPI001C0CEFCC|nr:bifunctional anthranilate synthase component I family protein/class IV aminotransferase [Polynucleobacter sp. Tro8-14-1]MBU3564115.1 bifunctional anthranilate synthase component I family protein/class IV aminotransferase [Polynucleobacter sp. Tro8-14-1]
MILLDDAQSTAALPTSRQYENALQYWRVLPSGNHAVDLTATQQCLTEISAALAKGEFIVAAFAYELGRQIHHLPERINHSDHHHPLIEAWSFAEFKKLSKQDVDNFITQRLASLDLAQASAGVMDVRQSLNEEQFTADIAAIQEYIRSGDSYQINHTYRITGKTYGAPLALYSRLRDRQPGRFGAFIEHEGNFLLSQSPELFIARDGDTIKAMPMKGTASALSTIASALSDDPKNQAENVMIVDLLRNDLSRISLPGTVLVPNLFEVARHGDVLQMTSTVQGQIKPEISLFDIFKAVFPCGSVTGAPKKRSMEIIQELEPEDRGYYCGALGWLDPNGNLAFSVPIRTVEITQDHDSHASSFTLGVGAGITNDSDAGQEWQECRIKSAFLMDLPSATGLFETIAVVNSEPQRLHAHLHRLSASAAALRIPFQLETAKKLISSACASLDKSLSYRLRIDLTPTGELLVTTAAMDLINEPVKIFWAKDILQGDVTMFSGDALLRHKISNRSLYDQAWQEAVNLGGFDALFINEQGFVTEGGRTSIFVKPQGSSKWLTPPVSAGLLPGVMRTGLLADPALNAREANLTINDVSMADEIMLSNALRGAIKAHF